MVLIIAVPAWPSMSMFRVRETPLRLILALRG